MSKSLPQLRQEIGLTLKHRGWPSNDMVKVSTTFHVPKEIAIAILKDAEMKGVGPSTWMKQLVVKYFNEHMKASEEK